MTHAEAVYGFYIPTVTLMGVGSHKQLGEQIKTLGAKKPLLVTDKGITDAGLTAQIADLIKDDTGCEVVVFDETVPNPMDKNVADGVAVFKESGCDMIITLGGGSPHDCGKGIGIVATNGGTIHDYEGVDQSTQAMPPFIAINTTAGTASEMTRFCIITDTSRKVKMAIVDWRVTPAIAINDPLLMVGMPSSLTAATGMDALTHAVEAYVSTIATPVTDACALKAIELVSDYLRPVVANGDDIEARDKMAYAEYLAGMAFNNASLGHVHAMAHQLGGFYNLPHGVCNAILLPHVSRYNLIARLDRFVDIAIAMGENVEGLSTREAAELAITAIQTLSRDIGIPENLTALGVKKEDLPTMAENAQKDACGVTNPRRPSLEDVIEIYIAAL
ncbi:iron-containing alcohol dehydrogenase [Desulfoluna spongiiphila]|uniref:iron-containing alcohol dehydrogenase n=1 Tax=Desulfoluna spongiiphila TaxID=419481 RepID=UPI001253D48F|nr:iron-containing alcohol dehydrogenase [Desulfoluna spongiiphila]VVS94705.1 alcohol dehydrogenase iron-type/glycerol dehydrogenase glda [Desulfoluna spongiiphila]